MTLSIRHVIGSDGQLNTIRCLVVHTFSLGDCSDPGVYSGARIIKWGESNEGKFVSSRTQSDLTLHHQVDYATYGHQYVITAELSEGDYTEFLLKFR
jgi:hypothetical protein